MISFPRLGEPSGPACPSKSGPHVLSDLGLAKDPTILATAELEASLNLHRRHRKESQGALVAAKLAKLLIVQGLDSAANLRRKLG